MHKNAEYAVLVGEILDERQEQESSEEVIVCPHCRVEFAHVDWAAVLCDDPVCPLRSGSGLRRAPLRRLRCRMGGMRRLQLQLLPLMGFLPALLDSPAFQFR